MSQILSTIIQEAQENHIYPLFTILS
jgi:hypothetical protein